MKGSVKELRAVRAEIGERAWGDLHSENSSPVLHYWYGYNHVWLMAHGATYENGIRVKQKRAATLAHQEAPTDDTR